jgi:hypothetical protein
LPLILLLRSKKLRIAEERITPSVFSFFLLTGIKKLPAVSHQPDFRLKADS